MKRYGIILVCICLLSGCGNTKTGSQETNNSQSREAKAELKSQTIWQVLDEEGNQKAWLEEEDPEVKEVKDTVEQHCGYVDSRTQMDQHLKEELKLYTEEFVVSLKESGYEEAVSSMYEENEIEISPDGLVWYVSSFNSDKTSCKVTVDAKFRFLSCNEEYLSARSLETGVTYQEQRVYYLEQRDGVWKISNIEKSALGKAAGLEV